MTLAPTQVQDDPALLERMMQEAAAADRLYRATNYWEFLGQSFLPELRQMGLRDFRRRPSSVLTSFGATDLRFEPVLRVRAGRASARASRWLTRAVRRLPGVSLDLPGFDSLRCTEYLHRLVAAKFAQVGLSLTTCPTTLVGNPADIVTIDGAPWSRDHLQVCSIFADACRHLRHRPDGVFCELGPGMGRQPEVWARMYPDATLLLFDIPPQLYVSHQYLSAVFGSRFIGYHDALALSPDSNGRIPEAARGRIIHLPSWKMPDWASARIDVFWNSASFQEMEPDVVANYLGLVRQMRPDWVYLNSMVDGNYWGAWKPGQGGTKVPVTTDYICRQVEQHQAYERVAEYATDYFLQQADHRSYIYRHRDVRPEG